jgi:hypothetical protein
MSTRLGDESDDPCGFDVMGHCKSVIWILAFVLAFLISAVVSFAPPNTYYRSFASAATGVASLSSVYHQAQLSGLTPLSSFLILWVRPRLSYLSPGSNALALTITAVFQRFSQGLEPFKSETVNLSVTTLCSSDACDPVRLYERHWVDFYSLSMNAIVEASPAALDGFSFEAASHSQIVAVSAFVLISITAVKCALVLFWVGFRRPAPTRPAHWAAFSLGLASLLVSGPWLVLKYYTSEVASQIFDLAPPIYHVWFVIFATFFMAERTAGLANRILSSLLLRGLIVGASLLVLVCEFVVASPMPLSTLAIYLPDSPLRFPIWGVSAVLQAGTIALFIFGLVSLQIERVTTLKLAAVIFGLVEAAFITRTYVRFFIPPTAVGMAFGVDLFYILIANVVTTFMLLNGLPERRKGEPVNQPELAGEVEAIAEDED